MTTSGRHGEENTPFPPNKDARGNAMSQLRREMAVPRFTGISAARCQLAALALLPFSLQLEPQPVVRLRYGQITRAAMQGAARYHARLAAV